MKINIEQLGFQVDTPTTTNVREASYGNNYLMAEVSVHVMNVDSHRSEMFSVYYQTSKREGVWVPFYGAKVSIGEKTKLGVQTLSRILERAKWDSVPRFGDNGLLDLLRMLSSLGIPQVSYDYRTSEIRKINEIDLTQRLWSFRIRDSGQFSFLFPEHWAEARVMESGAKYVLHNGEDTTIRPYVLDWVEAKGRGEASVVDISQGQESSREVLRMRTTSWVANKWVMNPAEVK